MAQLEKREDGSQFKHAYVIFTACGAFFPDGEFWKFQEAEGRRKGWGRWRGKKSILRKWRLRSIAGGYGKGGCTQAQCISHTSHVLVLYFLKRHTSSWLAVDLRSSQLWASALDFSFRGSVSDITSLRVHIKCMHITPQSCVLFPATLPTCKLQFGAPLLQA